MKYYVSYVLWVSLLPLVSKVDIQLITAGPKWPDHGPGSPLQSFYTDWCNKKLPSSWHQSRNNKSHAYWKKTFIVDISWTEIQVHPKTSNYWSQLLQWLSFSLFPHTFPSSYSFDNAHLEWADTVEAWAFLFDNSHSENRENQYFSSAFRALSHPKKSFLRAVLNSNSPKLSITLHEYSTILIPCRDGQR